MNMLMRSTAALILGALSPLFGDVSLLDWNRPEQFRCVRENWTPKTGSFKLVKTSDGKDAAEIQGPVLVIAPQRDLVGELRAEATRCNAIAITYQGDGSDEYGCVSIGHGPNLFYRAYFPLKNTAWQTVVVKLEQMIPSRGGPARFGHAITPGNSALLLFGDFWSIREGNRPRQPFTYTVSEVKLLEQPANADAALATLRKNLAAGQEVHILCVGDSITVGVGLPEALRTTAAYPARLQILLRQHYKNEKIFVHNGGIGGACGGELLGFLPRTAGMFHDRYDLVTLLFGFNDASFKLPVAEYSLLLEDFLLALRQLPATATATPLLIATLPGKGARSLTQDGFARAGKLVAARHQLPFCDATAAFRNPARPLLADEAHPNQAGYQLLAESLAKTIIGTTHHE